MGQIQDFSCLLNEEHHNFLRAATLTCGDALDHISSLPADTFVFLDPPYLERAGYEKGDGGFDLHAGLAVTLAELDLPWLIVHSTMTSTVMRTETSISLKFHSSIHSNGKDEQRPDAAVNHLYITNLRPNGRFVPCVL